MTAIASSSAHDVENRPRWLLRFRERAGSDITKGRSAGALRLALLVGIATAVLEFCGAGVAAAASSDVSGSYLFSPGGSVGPCYGLIPQTIAVTSSGSSISIDAGHGAMMGALSPNLSFDVSGAFAQRMTGNFFVGSGTTLLQGGGYSFQVAGGGVCTISFTGKTANTVSTSSTASQTPSLPPAPALGVPAPPTVAGHGSRGSGNLVGLVGLVAGLAGVGVLGAAVAVRHARRTKPSVVAAAAASAPPQPLPPSTITDTQILVGEGGLRALWEALHPGQPYDATAPIKAPDQFGWPRGIHGGAFSVLPDGTIDRSKPAAFVVPWQHPNPAVTPPVQTLLEPPDSGFEAGVLKANLENLGVVDPSIIKGGGKTYVEVPENLPPTWTGSGFGTLTVNGHTVFDPTKRMVVLGWKTPPVPPPGSWFWPLIEPRVVAAITDAYESLRRAASSGLDAAVQRVSTVTFDIIQMKLDSDLEQAAKSPAAASRMVDEITSVARLMGVKPGP